MNFGEALQYIDNWIQGAISLNKMSEGKSFSLPAGQKEREFNAVYKDFGAEALARIEESTIALTESISEYSLPAGCKRVNFIFYNQGVDIWKLTLIEAPDELAWAKGTESDSETGFYCTRYKQDKLMLYPAPSTTGDTITLYCQMQLDDLVEPTDEIAFIPEDYHMFLCDMVIARLMVMFGMYDPSKTNAVQLAAALRAEAKSKARELRHQLEFSNDQGRIRSAYSDFETFMNLPTINHEPIVNRLYYKDFFGVYNYDNSYPCMTVDEGDLTFFDDTTGDEIWSVGPSSVEYMGNVLYERISVTATGADMTYRYTGALNSNYDLQIIARRTSAPIAEAECWVRINHYGTMTPSVSLISNGSSKDGGSDIDISVTPVGAASEYIDIRVQNAYTGTLTILAFGRVNNSPLAIPSGVSNIVAGTNITITPAGGTGAVTINAASGTTIYSGEDNFAGAGSSTQVTIGATMPDAATYKIFIQPITDDPAGNMGEVYCTRRSDEIFVVYNSGTHTGKFSWLVIA